MLKLKLKFKQPDIGLLPLSDSEISRHTRSHRRIHDSMDRFESDPEAQPSRPGTQESWAPAGRHGQNFARSDFSTRSRSQDHHHRDADASYGYAGAPDGRAYPRGGDMSSGYGSGGYFYDPRNRDRARDAVQGDQGRYRRDRHRSNADRNATRKGGRRKTISAIIIVYTFA